jgi:hypothetical protein
MKMVYLDKSSKSIKKKLDQTNIGIQRCVVKMSKFNDVEKHALIESSAPLFIKVLPGVPFYVKIVAKRKTNPCKMTFEYSFEDNSTLMAYVSFKTKWPDHKNNLSKYRKPTEIVQKIPQNVNGPR